MKMMRLALFANLVALAMSDDPMGLMRGANGMYLACDTNVCGFDDAQGTWQYRLTDGRLHVLSRDGSDGGFCVVSGANVDTLLRLGSCDEMAATGMSWNAAVNDFQQNVFCFQASGNFVKVGWCALPFPISWPIEVPCNFKTQTFTNVKCKTMIGNNSCQAVWTGGDLKGASSSTDCNTCKAPNTTATCEFDFTVSTQISQSINWQQGIDIHEGIEVDIDAIFVSEKTSFSVDESFVTGQTITRSSSSQIKAGCSGVVPGGFRTICDGEVLTGSLAATFTADVTTVYECKQDHRTVSGTAVISNVPTTGVLSSCNFTQIDCGADFKYKCVGGKCVTAAEGGVALDVCKSVCSGTFV